MTTALELAGGTKLFVETSHALPLVSVSIALRTGNGHDPDGKEGLARIAMRMLRRGVPGLDATAIDELIDRLGSELAVDTGASSVGLHGQVIARNAKPFCELLGRMLREPTLPEEELARLQRETIAEIIESRDSDKTLAHRAFRRAIFGRHAYGRDGAGTTTTVRSFTLDDVRAFLTKNLVKSNLVVGFAGDITADQAAALTNALLEGLPDGPAPKDGIIDPAPLSGRRLVFVDKPERTQTQILMGGLGTWPHDRDHTDLSLGISIFGGTFTSRLMKEVRSKRGWSYGASARAPIERRRHAFSMHTFPAATDAAACIALELDLWTKLVSAGVTPKEVAFIQRFLRRSYAFDIDTPGKRLHQTLDVELLALPADYYSAYLDHVAAVTAESASAAVKARLSTEDAVVVVVGTAKDILRDVQQAIPNLSETRVVPYDEEGA